MLVVSVFSERSKFTSHPSAKITWERLCFKLSSAILIIMLINAFVAAQFTVFSKLNYGLRGISLITKIICY